MKTTTAPPQDEVEYASWIDFVLYDYEIVNEMNIELIEENERLKKLVTCLATAVGKGLTTRARA
jgi:hypothetical protein